MRIKSFTKKKGAMIVAVLVLLLLVVPVFKMVSDVKAANTSELAGANVNPGNAGDTPIVEPTATPTASTSPSPTVEPTIAPTVGPTIEPTATPIVSPTVAPTVVPTVAPTTAPTAAPTVAPTAKPTATPSSNLKVGGMIITIVDDNNQILPGAGVNILDVNGNLVSTEMSDSNGNVELNNLLAGSYLVEVISVPDGYKIPDTLQTVEVVSGVTTKAALSITKDDTDTVDEDTGTEDMTDTTDYLDDTVETGDSFNFPVAVMALLGSGILIIAMLANQVRKKEEQ